MPEQISNRRFPLRTFLALFLFLNFLYLLTSTGRVHTIDEISAVIQAESIALHGTTAVPQAVGSKVYFGKIGRDGQPHSAYLPGQSVAIVPWYDLGHFLIAKLPGVPAEVQDLVVSMTSTWSSATFAALAAALVLPLALALGLTVRQGVMLAFVIAVATPMFVYSAWLFTEPLTAALWMGAAVTLFAPGEISLRRAAIAGLLLGCAMWVRPATVLAPVVFLAAMLARDGRRALRPAMVLALVVGLIGVSILARNQILFGNVTDFGGPRYGEAGRDMGSFNIAWHVGLEVLLFSPGKSALLFCPLVVLAIPALGRLWRRDRGLAIVCGAVPLVNLLFYGHYSCFEGGYSYGPRYLVPSLALLCVSLAAWFLDPPRWWKKAFAALFAIGLAVQVIGLSTNVLEDMVANHYYDARYFYQTNYSPITGQLRLVAKYMGGAPAPLGMGFDRWFLFADKAGVPGWIIGVLMAIMTAGLVVSGWRLLKQLRTA
jgi:hypothetical protein